ncbi:GIN domain-containing protein [Pseudoroseicyclus sp. H15]
MTSLAKTHVARPALVAGMLATALAAPTLALAETRSYDVAGFTRIDVSDGLDAVISEGDFSVEAEARRGDLDRLVVEVEGDTLKLGREARMPLGLLQLLRQDEFSVTVHLPEMSGIHAGGGANVRSSAPAADGVFTAGATGGANLRITGIEADEVTADSLSGANLRLEVEAREVTLNAQSGANLRASGSCGTLSASGRSGASLMADDMACEMALLDASSGASMRASASQSAEANASSGASIAVYGGGEVDATETSGGSVRSR